MLLLTWFNVVSDEFEFTWRKSMPIHIEKKLREEAERKYPGDKKRQNTYVYGTLRKLGWKRKKETT